MHILLEEQNFLLQVACICAILFFLEACKYLFGTPNAWFSILGKLSELHGKDTYLKHAIFQFRLVHKPFYGLIQNGLLNTSTSCTISSALWTYYDWCPCFHHLPSFSVSECNSLLSIFVHQCPRLLLLPSESVVGFCRRHAPTALLLSASLWGAISLSTFYRLMGSRAFHALPACLRWDLIHNCLTWSLSLMDPKPLPPGSSLYFQLPAKISNSPLSPKLHRAVETHCPTHPNLLSCSRTSQSINKWSEHAKYWSMAVTRSQLPLQVMEPCHQLAIQPVDLARTPSLLLHVVLLPIMPCSEHSSLHCLSFHHCSQGWYHGSGLCFCKTLQLLFLPLIWPLYGVRICLHTYLSVQVLQKIL